MVKCTSSLNRARPRTASTKLWLRSQRRLMEKKSSRRRRFWSSWPVLKYSCLTGKIWSKMSQLSGSLTLPKKDQSLRLPRWLRLEWWLFSSHKKCSYQPKQRPWSMKQLYTLTSVRKMRLLSPRWALAGRPSASVVARCRSRWTLKITFLLASRSMT